MKRIRNGQIRRDFKRLLTLLAEADTKHEAYKEAETIAQRNGLYYDDDGIVREERSLQLRHNRSQHGR